MYLSPKPGPSGPIHLGLDAFGPIHLGPGPLPISYTGIGVKAFIILLWGKLSEIIAHG